MDPLRNYYLLLLLGAWGIFIFICTLPPLDKKYGRNATNDTCPNDVGVLALGPQVTVFRKDRSRPQTYNRSSPFVFISGFPRSGTTLLGSVLDAHSAIRCGTEPLLVPRILQMFSHWTNGRLESKRLRMAHLPKEVIGNAVAAFILQIVAKGGEAVDRLCSNFPLNSRSGHVMQDLFPSSKLIFLIRDGRAVVYSMISRNMSVSGFDLEDTKSCLEKWSNQMEDLWDECLSMGDTKCLRVRYESLVLNTKVEMERILKYLDVEREESILHHEPVYKDALSKWVGEFPPDIVEDIGNIAPMLSVLGYDPWANPPNYSLVPPFADSVKDYEYKEGNDSVE